MKQILFVLISVLFVLPLYANHLSSGTQLPSFALDTIDYSTVLLSDNSNAENNNVQPTENVETVSSMEDLSFARKKRMTNGLLWTSAAFASSGLTYLITAVIMGFIPYTEFSDEMLYEPFFEIVYKNGMTVHYPRMMIYCSVGAVLFCAGTLVILFSLPVLIYGIVRKVCEKKQEKLVAEKPHWELAADSIRFRF